MEQMLIATIGDIAESQQEVALFDTFANLLRSAVTVDDNDKTIESITDAMMAYVVAREQHVGQAMFVEGIRFDGGAHNE